VGRNNRSNRPQRKRTRSKRARRATGSGWLAVGPPDEAVLNANACPVDTACVGCGAHQGLHAVVAVFGDAATDDTACATVCPTCDGRSLLSMLGAAGLRRAIAAHVTHTLGEGSDRG
jgi:ferredoxin